MRRVVSVLLVAALCAVAGERALAQGKAQTAQELVERASVQAAAHGKAVLIEFGASWCVWCRSFEALVKAPDTGPIIDKHFLILNLTVREEEEKKALNTPGADELMKMWGGEKSGLPFYVFLDGRRQMIANSNAMPDGTNIGFPAVPAEVSAFMTLIDKAAPKLTRADRSTVQAYLVRVMPKPKEPGKP